MQSGSRTCRAVPWRETSRVAHLRCLSLNLSTYVLSSSICNRSSPVKQRSLSSSSTLSRAVVWSKSGTPVAGCVLRKLTPLETGGLWRRAARKFTRAALRSRSCERRAGQQVGWEDRGPAGSSGWRRPFSTVLSWPEAALPSSVTAGRRTAAQTSIPGGASEQRFRGSSILSHSLFHK